MTVYETKLRGARKRIKDAIALAPAGCKDDLRTAVEMLDVMIDSASFAGSITEKEGVVQ